MNKSYMILHEATHTLQDRLSTQTELLALASLLNCK